MDKVVVPVTRQQVEVCKLLLGWITSGGYDPATVADCERAIGIAEAEELPKEVLRWLAAERRVAHLAVPVRPSVGAQIRALQQRAHRRRHEQLLLLKRDLGRMVRGWERALGEELEPVM